MTPPIKSQFYRNEFTDPPPQKKTWNLNIKNQIKQFILNDNLTYILRKFKAKNF